MTSQKQIDANRANAQRSTGPKTAAGKMKSSRNSFRHGLSRPAPLDGATLSGVEILARSLMPQGGTEAQWGWALSFAQAVSELVKLRAIRAHLLPAGYEMETRVLKQLAALDRFERYAHTKRRRALENLERERPLPIEGASQ